jgi:hypothetical protein
MDTSYNPGNSEDDDLDTKFVEGQWLGVGKKYTQNLPAFVHLAETAQQTVPTSFLLPSHWPDCNIPVLQFIDWRLPRISSEIISTKTLISPSGILSTFECSKME